MAFSREYHKTRETIFQCLQITPAPWNFNSFANEEVLVGFTAQFDVQVSMENTFFNCISSVNVSY